MTKGDKGEGFVPYIPTFHFIPYIGTNPSPLSPFVTFFLHLLETPLYYYYHIIIILLFLLKYYSISSIYYSIYFFSREREKERERESIAMLLSYLSHFKNKTQFTTIYKHTFSGQNTLYVDSIQFMHIF